ncbi:aspartate/tyrosine/aromatic aminotransferase [Psychrosphaera sp. F3M07]|jgi:aspartate aminotransferase|uniref:amino acid aminotransferase n=1 Tax=Psychrosphaera sp. F3M07 TaxID=2841560 RepID=UPI001C0A5D8D|nr:amino acid aminotransferase [Psychrosphaera sp. F3M07]MBU2917828.1 aspartate/tyrosine/aromatic aminotransferase [Psychrosphaera sp. F3M07]
MFNQLQPVPTDPILGLMTEYKADNNPKKVDLSVGVYKNEQGDTPVLAAVKKAEEYRLNNEQSKAYLGMAGDVRFNEVMTNLLFGEHDVVKSGRVKTAQTPGGTGSLRVAAEFIARCNPTAKVWVTNPTWANHISIFNAAGLQVEEFPYFDFDTMGLKFDQTVETLSKVPAGDIVLLHACCHNPSGMDLNLEQWQTVADIAKQQGFTILIDSAYQGFGEGLNEDAAGLRLLASQVEEMIVCSSCSKNFGLYRDRIGAISIIGTDPAKTEIAFSVALGVIRAIYSMPPAHGADIVATILSSQELTSLWHQELDEMRTRINGLRSFVVDKFKEKGVPGNFDFIAKQNGMFSFLGIDKESIATLKKDYSIYIVGSSRVNVAGVNDSNADYLADALAKVLNK